jgi:hypothetical protein
LTGVTVEAAGLDCGLGFDADDADIDADVGAVNFDAREAIEDLTGVTVEVAGLGVGVDVGLGFGVADADDADVGAVNVGLAAALEEEDVVDATGFVDDEVEGAVVLARFLAQDGTALRFHEELPTRLSAAVLLEVEVEVEAAAETERVVFDAEPEAVCFFIHEGCTGSVRVCVCVGVCVCIFALSVTFGAARVGAGGVTVLRTLLLLLLLLLLVVVLLLPPEANRRIRC